MTVAKRPHRGEELLLAHCSCTAADLRPTAFMRLEEKVGEKLARLLVFALASSQGRRGSSSP